MRFRLAEGGRIDRTRRLRFTFNGRGYEGFAGDTLASALIANGVHLVARSFKYHRPRGILTAGAEEPSALVQLGWGARSEPNLRATQVELYNGLIAEGINAWPSVAFDLGAWTGVLSKLFVAGFYYKTFLWPAAFWRSVYEPAIRRMAGLGHAPREPDPDIYDKMHIHCDVLVVGGGPAGIAAALTAGRAGARVIIADDQAALGGSLASRAHAIAGRPAMDWVAEASAELDAMPEVTVLPRTTVFGYYDHNTLSALERRTDHLGPARDPGRPGQPRQRLWHIRARRVVLAAGAHERPLVFADNDRPGVMLASAGQAYVNRYAALPGRRVVLFTNNDGAYEAALDLARAGATVAAIVDSRTDTPGALPQAAAERGIRAVVGSVITATHGVKRVRGVTVMTLAPDGRRVAGERRRIACDCVLVSGGWNPAVHLFCQSGGKLRFDEARGMMLPDAPAQPVDVAGACAGVLDLAGCLETGFAAGAAAAEATGFRESAVPPTPAVEAPEPGGIAPLWLVPSRRPIGHGRAKHFVDHQDDVTAHDIRLAAREGFHSVEHVKRYTTLGMGTDQGKTSNVTGLAILAETLGKAIPEVGTTTYRPPYTPVTFGALAGRDRDLRDPVRRTAMHEWHEANGAVLEAVGQWRRPWWYPRPGEDRDAAVARECRAVREAVGILDASTLGKIDIQGPDAAELLNRVYTNGWSKLGIGRVRYGLMCRDDGMVFDDGTTARLGENHFLMTTTTGNAAAVLDWLEEWLQTEWPELQVFCTSVTEQWATIAMAGPKARAVLGTVAPDMPLDAESFPFMSVARGAVAGVPARVFRISFTGELSFEINVPWHTGRAVWEAVMAAGAEHGITPYGTEAMHVLRAERGFIIVGQETDGTTTPFDLGMDRIVSTKKPDFIGKRAWARPDTARNDRKQLVGILTEDPAIVLPEGMQLTETDGGAPPVPMIGHVTSSYMSPTLGRSIALALVSGGRARIGQKIFAALPDRPAVVAITDPVFYDPDGARRDG